MIQSKLYSDNIWRKKVIIITSVKQIESNGMPYPYLYIIGDLVWGSFHKGFHVCIDQGSFFKNFPTNSELKIN